MSNCHWGCGETLLLWLKFFQVNAAAVAAAAAAAADDDDG